MIHARSDYARIQDPAAQIPTNEPVFLIRGQDALAVEVMEFYLRRYIEQAAYDEVVVVELARHIRRVRAWPKKKTADVPGGI